MKEKNNSRNDIAMEYKTAKYIAGIFAAIWMAYSIKSITSAAIIPEIYIGGQENGGAAQQMYGWHETDGRRYYFLSEIGQMAVGWMEIDSKSYYFFPDTGQMVTGWMEIDGGTYYFYPGAGWMAVGWTEIDGGTYYFYPETGRMATGWTEIGGETYYFYPETGQMAAGWIEIGSGTYYFYPETGRMAAGWMETGGGTYYFYPETGQMATGWIEIDGETYYFLPETGSMATGCWEIEDDTYYFSPDTGKMQTGWQETENGRRYFDKASGIMAIGWWKIKGAKYYFSENGGEPAAGLNKIDGEYYLFHPNGCLADTGKTSLVPAGNQIYCADKNGKPVSGWQVIGKKLYYASKTGKVKKNTSYRGITFGSSGAAKNNVNTQLKIKAIKTFASITKKNMTKKQKLAACWSYITDGRFRYAAKYPDLDADGWQREAAYDMLSSQAGNCYSFACAFAALAEEAGYRPYIICGRVRGSRDRMADGYTRHAWVRINGEHYDPEAHYAGWRRGIYGNSSYPVSYSIQKIVAY